jgi:hypothetical protein
MTLVPVWLCGSRLPDPCCPCSELKLAWDHVVHVANSGEDAVFADYARFMTVCGEVSGAPLV